MDTPTPDLFDPTPRTTMVQWMRSNEKPRVRDFLMRTYLVPLAGYLSATSYRRLGEPRDVVAGFFASRLDRDGWLESWRDSGIRLRRWLMTGLLFYCREEVRRQQRTTAVEVEVEEPIVPSAEQQFESEYAQTLVRSATESARASCETDGLVRHWNLFLRHFVDGATYEVLARDEALSVGQVNGMVRTAMSRFRTAVGEALLMDGADPRELDAEIQALLARLRR